EVIDQLRQVFDGIDVMVRRRRNQRHAGHGVAQSSNQAVDLATGQLTTLARLGTLGDLDLQHFAVDQVFRGYAETAGGHLLDLRTLVSAVTGRVFTTLTGVGATAYTVHRLGDGFVGLWRQCAEGDARGIEAREDRLQRLDLVEG